MALYRNEPARWAEMAERAAAERFGWSESAKTYAGLYAGEEAAESPSGNL